MLERLCMALAPELVSQRNGPGGKKLSYITSYEVFAIANSIFGSDGWLNEVVSTSVEHDARDGDFYDITIRCEAKVTVLWPGGTSSTHANVGYGHGHDRKRGAAHESAGKEAYTDAIKRALVLFGHATGLCLYNQDYLQWLVDPQQNKINSTDRKWHPGLLLDRSILSEWELAHPVSTSFKESHPEPALHGSIPDLEYTLNPTDFVDEDVIMTG